MEDNKALIPGAIVIAGLIIAGAVIYSLGGGGNTGSPDTTGLTPQEEARAEATNDMRPLSESDHVLGNRDAEVVVVEYSDIQCPFCQNFHGTVHQLIDTYDGKVAWAYRHFPLDQIHPEATPAAIAAECVAELANNDAFWSFVDSMFANQDSLGDALYTQTALTLGVDAGDFATCRTQEDIATIVQNDLTNATQSGGTGTPYSLLVYRTELTDEAREVLTALSDGLRRQGSPTPVQLVEDNNLVIVSGALPFEVLQTIVDALLGE